jgi:ATP-dependent DNA helicase RecQ
VHVVPSQPASPFISELFNEPPARSGSAGSEPPRAVRRGESASASLGDRLAASRPGHDFADDDRTLFEQLKELRRHLAAGKPAYVVFGDAVLAAMVEQRPADLEALGTIRGVGPAKLQQYGAAFVGRINQR